MQGWYSLVVIVPSVLLEHGWRKGGGEERRLGRGQNTGRRGRVGRRARLKAEFGVEGRANGDARPRDGKAAAGGAQGRRGKGREEGKGAKCFPNETKLPNKITKTALNGGRARGDDISSALEQVPVR
jgi:hypothetical protein